MICQYCEADVSENSVDEGLCPECGASLMGSSIFGDVDEEEDDEFDDFYDDFEDDDELELDDDLALDEDKIEMIYESDDLDEFDEEFEDEFDDDDFDDDEL